ncbi:MULTISPECIES: hypothetical protein [unclassified Crossiella]|uniref:NucA/NucB deoxyribonuclease domain-containing protein n=1 Tax=unclassified Crossiella TaxID=2620835 RepID=UPI001FFF8823|nr:MULTISPECIES: hypothetical protein [unclassified Crossiella]MCK2240696.1 hypothetical protein [Crossiella sp. S99.2]MCK2252853.1 hypothetical protein [Crossiella sp. S99.1]
MATIIDPSTGQPQGTATVKYTAAGIANPLNRLVHVWFRGDDYKVTGTFTRFSHLRLKVVCTMLTVGCSVNNDWITKQIGDWNDGKWHDWVINSDETQSAQQPEKVLRNLWAFTGQAVDSTGAVTVPGYGARHGIRCDSADYFRFNPKACIFTDVIPHLQYRYNEGYDGVTAHINRAQNSPAQTYPNYGTEKKIPGKYLGDPNDLGLQRVAYDGPTWNLNAAEKTKACNRRPPYTGPNQLPPYDTETRQCDEYPFASTAQGAGKGDGNFSVQDVLSAENGRAGIGLRLYYVADRILYGDLDAFYVRAG